MSEDLAFLSASELHEAFRARRISPVEVLQACLAQVARLDGRFNAMAHVDGTGARLAARQAERRFAKGMPLGPLDGVPVVDQGPDPGRRHAGALWLGRVGRCAGHRRCTLGVASAPLRRGHPRQDLHRRAWLEGGLTTIR